MRRILLLTAGFGEGHNTASRCLAEALCEHPRVETSVVDVYHQTVPRFTKVLQSGYSLAINKYPFVWSAIFSVLDRPGALEKSLPLARNLCEGLRRVLDDYKPDVIVSTYPLYAYLIRQLRRKGHGPSAVPLLTMVTDSTVINSSWYRAGSEAFLVADEETAEVLRQGGADPASLQVLGFPVTPRLASLRPCDGVIHGAKRVLYIPSSRSVHTISVIRELQKLPDLEITIVTGRLKALYEDLLAAGVADGVKTHLVGWTDKVPELLCTHHLYIGKAGGAIVHEAMAACCPILVSHVVPGQEEGNIELIERHDIGRLAASQPAVLACSVSEIFADHETIWKRWKKNLQCIARPGASRDIAAFILKAASKEIPVTGAR